MTHNAAILALDAIVQLAVSTRSLTSPPVAPVPGERHLVASGASGDWAGKDNQIAVWQDGQWAFFQPGTGWIAWVEEEGRLFAWAGGSWTAISLDAAQSAPMIGVNAQPDVTNRLSVTALATLFNHEGEGHQLKINKNGVADTASLLFQTNWSGRAEMGTSGDDDWHLKVSPDGSSWQEALLIATDDGAVTIVQELILPDGVRIANTGDTETAGVEIEGDGVFGNVALTIKSVSGLTGALFEQRSLLGSDLDLIDFGFKTLSQQINFRVESRSQYSQTGGTPEWQINDESTIVSNNLFAISPSHAKVQVPLGLKAYTVATLPAAAAAGVGVGALSYVTDAAGGAVPAFNDGTNWRTVSDRTILA